MSEQGQENKVQFFKGDVVMARYPESPDGWYTIGVVTHEKLHGDSQTIIACVIRVNNGEVWDFGLYGPLRIENVKLIYRPEKEVTNVPNGSGGDTTETAG
jgi:hypothetical protein